MSFGERIKLIFTLGNIIKVSFLSILTFLVCLGVSNYSNSLIKETLNRGLIERTKILELENKKDLPAIKCVLLNCDYIKDNGVHYRFKNGMFVPAETFSPVNMDGSYDEITVNGVTYFLNKNLELELSYIAKLSSYSTGAFTFLILFFFLMMSYNNRRFSYRVTKDMLEDLIQKELTESLHHELSGPIVVLESKVEMLKTIKQDDPLRENIIGNIDNSITVIRDILNIMANRKHLKYTNGTIPIERLIENSVAFNRIKHLGMAEIIIENQDLFSNYSLQGLDNGVLVNILNNLITNSREAGASIIKIYGNSLQKQDHITGKTVNYIELYCSDNGSGVRDKQGNIAMDNKIFKYAYSTKDNTGNKIQAESLKGIWNKLRAMIGGIDDVQSVRGAGLAISKKLLLSVNDDIELYETSESGTTFKLTLRVKSRLYNEDESRLIEDLNK